MTHILLAYGQAAMWFAIAVNGLYLAIFLVAATQVGHHARQASYRATPENDAYILPPISILVPAYNESVTAETTIRSLLRLDYPRLEIILVNDGSSDDTLSVLKDAFALEPVRRKAVQLAIPVVTQPKTIYRSRLHQNLLVIDKPNSGKGDTLNTAINFATSPLVTAIDADTLLERDSLRHIAQAYIHDPSRTVALGGQVRIGNGCRIVDGQVVEAGVPTSLLARCQLIEYTKAFVGGRVGWAAANGLIIVSGAFGVFRRDVLARVGGYTTRRPGEDMELVLHIHKYMRDHRIPYRVAFCPQAVGWTQAPEKLSILAAQRRRWGKGNVHNAVKYRGMFFNLRYGVLGTVSFPYTVLVEMLNPYILFTGLLAIVALAFLLGADVTRLLWLFALNLGLDYVHAFGALMLDDVSFATYKERDLVRIGLTALHMPLWYFYLSNFWRVGGHVEYFTNNQGWGTMARQSWTSADDSGDSHGHAD